MIIYKLILYNKLNKYIKKLELIYIKQKKKIQIFYFYYIKFYKNLK